MIELKVKGNIMSKPVNCGCGGNVDIHFIGNTYIGDYHKFTGKYFICCEKCGVETPICKTREEAIKIWNEAMGADKNSIISVFPAELMDTTIVQKINSVTPVKIEYYNEDNLCASGHICPNCHTNVIVKYKYCPECGMKLEWSEE